jgi:hydrogenase-4 component F
MLEYYFVLAVAISGSMILVKNRAFNRAALALFTLLQISVMLFGYFNAEETDALFFKYDMLGVLLTAILTLLTPITFYHSYLYLKRHPCAIGRQSIYWAALIILITAMTGAYFAENVALLWVCIEVTTLCVTVLVFHERSKTSLEASWKYLFISSVGVAIAFMGILFLTAVSVESGPKSLNFTDLIANSQSMNSTWLKIAFILVLTGFSIKLSIFPLFAAAIDAKTIAPSPVNALLSSALVNVGFVGIFRFYTIIAQTDAAAWAANVLMITGMISIFLAAIQLFKVKRFTRMYALSSMEHAGIICLALFAGGIGYYAAILHVVLHSLVKAGLFYQLGQSNYIFKSIWIKDSGAYFKINPMAALVVLAGFFSIVAIPPSGLFVTEFLIFKTLFLEKHILVAIVALLLLTVILYQIARFLFHLLFEKMPEHLSNAAIHVNKLEIITPFLLFVLAAYLGYSPPEFFVNMINSAIASIQ